MVDLSMKLKENARNIMLVLAYDGGQYHGFQRQKNAISVQNILEQKLAVLFGHTIELAASGRTDAGVHAYGQVVNFFTIGTIPIDRVVKAINSLLPDDIVVQKAREMDMEFSARHSAKDKTYIYRVQQGELLDPFLRSYTWFVKKSLNIDLMNQALAMLVGEHDFSAFQAAGSAPMHPVRTIYRADCEKQNNEIIFTFWGNGFLYHMVRNIVGTIVNVGLEKTSIEKFREIFYSKDRKKAGATAPAQGLYLKEVNY
ncbi:tRNA pseudouridine(38-40) synthase TruA [Anaerosinus gibii]|uniref:tRNA pseudouridine synthase A n=1 Tax=Selenobaculum gibii TaxID=3054208 RepID=A0A9Y2AI23_9FIRM|nr:tRNA pseudouridine(38-40) synthase TruA [Selenobaculum gbiensis]WIW70063.1 tRNA pseudouridine(38-40) synthase TruA [Selenobaculum gbiensis]